MERWCALETNMKDAVILITGVAAKAGDIGSSALLYAAAYQTLHMTPEQAMSAFVTARAIVLVVNKRGVK